MTTDYCAALGITHADVREVYQFGIVDPNQGEVGTFTMVRTWNRRWLFTAALEATTNDS